MILTRLQTYREIIKLTKQNEKQYKAELRFYRAADPTPSYDQAMTLNIVSDALRSPLASATQPPPVVPPDGASPPAVTTPSAEQQMPFGERPYVLAEDVQFVDDEQKVQIRYHNSGKTPAIDLGLSSRYAIADSGFDLDKIKPEDLSQPSGYGNVNAGMWITNELDTHKRDHAPEFNAMKQGQLHGYVFGFLRYKDLAGFSYEPRFCFVWSAQDGAFVRCPANAFMNGQKL